MHVVTIVSIRSGSRRKIGPHAFTALKKTRFPSQSARDIKQTDLIKFIQDAVTMSQLIALYIKCMKHKT
jgi:hypothetical protein